MKIINIVGARPNFVKIAPLMEEMAKYSKIEAILLHTGQHYDKELSGSFFKDLEIPKPDIYLGVGSGSHAEQTAKTMIKFEKVCLKEKPDLVLVVGDVNSTLACSLVAVKLHIPVAHVEAGLRSFDREMPEEINRIVTDSVASILFTTSKNADKNLLKEGVDPKRIFFVGNVMIDTLMEHKKKAGKLNVLKGLDLEKKQYALLTLHRPSNVDDRQTFLNIINALKKIQEEIKIIFPAHPRTLNKIRKFKLTKTLNRMENFFIMKPLGYLDFLNLLSNTRLVLTDSGGIQEETTILGIPCLTLRENTERPVTVKYGTNKVVGTDSTKIIKEVKKIVQNKKQYKKRPELWDGKATRRILKILVHQYKNKRLIL